MRSTASSIIPRLILCGVYKLLTIYCVYKGPNGGHFFLAGGMRWICVIFFGFLWLAGGGSFSLAAEPSADRQNGDWLKEWLSAPPPGQFASQQLAAIPASPPSVSPPSVDEWLRDFPRPLLTDQEDAPAHDPEVAAAPESDNESKNEAENETAVDEENGDPLEPMNRVFFGFNELFQSYLLGPIADSYNWLPGIVREAIGNFLENLNEPVVLANDLLQFQPMRAWETAERIVINSTVGVGGLIDVADQMGIPAHDEDFGQTLAMWGVGEGFYLVLPLLGPSNPRDALGKLVVDNFFDPLNLWLVNSGRQEYVWSRAGVSGVRKYADVVGDLRRIKSTSMDYYAAIRSMYRQKRAAEINNGEQLDGPDIPDFYE